MAAASRFAGCADVADMLERLPFELGEAVYEHAGLATQLLHGRLPLPLDDRTSALVWIECMANDLVGCVPLLPLRSLTFEPYLARPSRAMVAAIRKKPRMPFVDLSSVHLERVAKAAAACSLETCQMLYRKEFKKRVRFVRGVPVFPRDGVKTLLTAAAGVGDTATMQSILSTRIQDLGIDLSDAIKAALRYDQVVSLETLLPRIDSPKKLVPVAMDANAVECFKMLVAKAPVDGIASNHIFGAVKDNRSVMIQKILENRHKLSHKQLDWLVKASVKYRRLDLLRAVSSGGFSLGQYVDEAGEAAAWGDMEMFDIFRPHLVGNNWFKVAMRIAAGKGNLDAVRRLHSDFDLACDHGAMDAAAARGHMDVIEFLRTHRTEGFSGAAMIGAAQGGHLGVVRFLHEQQIECNDTEAMDGAACNGHIDILEFFRTERGARCSSKAIVRAAGNNYLRSVKWLLEHFPDESKQEMSTAIQYAVEWHDPKLPSKLIVGNETLVGDRITRRLIQRKWFDLAKLVLESRHFKTSFETVRQAYFSKNLDIFKLVIDLWNHVPPAQFLIWAIRDKRLEMARMLIDHGVQFDIEHAKRWASSSSETQYPCWALLVERFPDLDWETFWKSMLNSRTSLALFIKNLIKERDAGAAQSGKP
ncbi:hypothetical protein HK105_201302 [Polyrhizophydium stewartii]|uniref:Ankyrin repeat protein n=1 Tax=Polyrhizophydium stewartii TaxID=2732419 RepID=A0ABR4NHP6_9FUNG